MPGKPSKEVARARGVVAGLSRSRPLDDPNFAKAHQELKAAKLADHIAKAVAEAPPLSPEQIDRLAGLLKPVAGGAS